MNSRNNIEFFIRNNIFHNKKLKLYNFLKLYTKKYIKDDISILRMAYTK